MSKRKANNQAKWENFKKATALKRSGKKSDEVSTTMQYITVQRLSATVEGKCQKYSRIGPVTMVPFGDELTLDNVKAACIKHFKIPSYMESRANEAPRLQISAKLKIGKFCTFGLSRVWKTFLCKQVRAKVDVGSRLPQTPNLHAQQHHPLVCLLYLFSAAALVILHLEPFHLSQKCLHQFLWQQC